MAADGAGVGETAWAAEGIAAPGDVVGGKFVVERVLGVGGMGVVVAARHMQLGQTVAIKFLRRNAAASGESVNRFVREARAAVGLQSAHVVRIMDVGALDDGLPYMVMEHLSGTDLSHVLEVRRMLPIQEAVDYLLQAMEAIAEAHAVGIIHRDLKPSNLFLTMRPDGTPLVKVLDFGISKAIDDGSQQASLTSTAMVMGSPLYMSPEQVRSTKNVDIRTDLWALGVILYELLVGVPPFEADTVTGLCAKIVADPPIPLRARRPDLPHALESVVVRCLDKDPKKRHQSVAALAQALRPFASADGKAAVERVSRIGATPRASLRSTPDPARSAQSGPVALELPSGYAETIASQQATTVGSRRRRGVVGVAIAGVIVAAAVLGLARDRIARSGAEADRPAAARDPALAPLAVTHPPSPSIGTSPRIAPPPTTAPATASAPDADASSASLAPSRTVAVQVTAAPPVAAAPPAAAIPPAATPSRTTLAPAPRAASKPAPSKSSSDDLLLDRK